MDNESFSVAQIFNLPYRRIESCRPTEASEMLAWPDALPIAYSAAWNRNQRTWGETPGEPWRCGCEENYGSPGVSPHQKESPQRATIFGDTPEVQHRAPTPFDSARSRALSAWMNLFLFLLVFLFANGALAETEPFRFPPPEFESGYKLPLTSTSGPRAVALQYLDVLVLFVALGVAAYLTLKQRSRVGVIGLSIFSLAYFGFYRRGCVCAIGSVQNVALALFNPQNAVPFPVLAFFLAPLVVALFAGRAFCAGVCPHGAIQDIMLLKPVKVPVWLEQALGVLPFVYLGAGALFAATGSAFVICRYDPFVPIFRLGGSFMMLAVGITFLLVGMFVGRPYCRFLCPYGALLRLTSIVSKWRVTVTPDACNQCRLCEQSCPFGALHEPTLPLSGLESLAIDRRRLTRLLVVLPLLVFAGGWIGFKLTNAASRVHPTVELAERYARHKVHPRPAAPQTAERLSIQRAEVNPQLLLADSTRIQRRFVTGSWLFGGWVGLVVGVKLISLSVRRRRTDYEPDRAACLSCARCFRYCPNERVRIGLMPVAAIGSAPATAQLAEKGP